MKVFVHSLLVIMFCTIVSACSSSSSNSLPSIPSPSSKSESDSKSSEQTASEQTQKKESAEQKQANNTNESSSQDAAKKESEISQAGGAQTDEEKVAMLDKQLEKELSEYDKQLHKELEKAEDQKQAKAREREAIESAEDGIDADEEDKYFNGEDEKNTEQGDGKEGQLAKTESQQRPKDSEADSEDKSNAGEIG